MRSLLVIAIAAGVAAATPALAQQTNNSAKEFAPGQQKGPAKKYAPGQKQKNPGQAKQFAPGQQMHEDTTGRGDRTKNGNR